MSRVAQIGLGVRFRTRRGVFWHRSALVSDSARRLGPALPSHRRSTCGNAGQPFSAWFFWLAESDTKADPCQKTPLRVRNRTRRPIRAITSPPLDGTRRAALVPSSAAYYPVPPSFFGSHNQGSCIQAWRLILMPRSLQRAVYGRNSRLCVDYTCGREIAKPQAGHLPAKTRDRSNLYKDIFSKRHVYNTHNPQFLPFFGEIVSEGDKQQWKLGQ